MSRIREKVDVCVIGAGHAGCEAALACARLGLETIVFTEFCVSKRFNNSFNLLPSSLMSQLSFK